MSMGVYPGGQEASMRSQQQSIRSWVGGACAATFLVMSGCAQPPAATPVAQDTAKKLPVVDLDEKPAFPLAKHLESKDLAAGTVPFAELFEDAAQLFHSPSNRL